jgi:hypothetical protein
MCANAKLTVARLLINLIAYFPEMILGDGANSGSLLKADPEER